MRAGRFSHGRQRPPVLLEGGALAAARIAPIFEDAWWDTASPRDVAAMWQEAATWSTHPEDGAVGPAPTIFDHAVGGIGRELHERSGLAAADLAVLAELQQLEHEHQEPGLASQRPAELASERSEDPTLAAVSTAGGGAPVTTGRGARGFDDPERRERLRHHLAVAGVPEEGIQAGVLADIGQAREPAQATQTAGQPPEPAQHPSGRGVTEQRRRHR